MSFDRLTFTLAILLAVGAADAGCKKSFEREQREAARATAEAEREASKTTITSGTMDSNDNAAERPLNAEERAAQAEDEALRQQAQAIASLRREQLDLRARVQRELDELDGRVATSKDTKNKKSLLGERDLLKGDLDAIDRSTAEDWPSVKTRIDLDLRLGLEVTPRSDRPWAQPRTP